jgi:hypothetical protein
MNAPINLAKNASGVYTRPARTAATNVGDVNRRRFHKALRSLVFDLIPHMEWLVASETTTSGLKARPWSDRPAWAVLRVRLDHIALLDLLQRRHLNNTGKEVSRAEVLAALMAAGLPRLIDHPDFAEDRKTKANRNAAAAEMQRLGNL